MFLNNISYLKIWKIALDNNISIFTSRSDKAGYKDGKIEDALFNNPTALDIDEKDNIYVADTGNNAIRKITPDGVVSTIYKEPS